MFIYRLMFLLALSAFALGAKTGTASPAIPTLNPTDVICGLPHGKDIPQSPVADNAQAVPFSGILLKMAVQSVKSHGSTCPLHTGGHAVDCPPSHAGICCPTGSGDSAITGKIIDIFTQPPYGSAGFWDTAIVPISQQTLYRSHQSGPDPRPPAI